MSKHPTLLQHFRSFVYQNKIEDFDLALEYFVVFGGTGWSVDTSKSLESLIEQKILRNYESIHRSMTRYTHNNPIYHRVLSAIALGTEHEYDVFKKSKIGRDRGEEAVDYLEKKSLIRFDLSVVEPIAQGLGISDRVIFRLPFMRFWFAMVSSHYQGISSGDFAEFSQKWQEQKPNYHILINNLLVRDMVVQSMRGDGSDPIVSMGSYYDKSTRIEILARRESGKILAGECKYSRESARANMPNSLKQKCQKAELEIDEYLLFSQNGFTDEVLEMSDMRLFSADDLSMLLANLTEKDQLVYKNQKY